MALPDLKYYPEDSRKPYATLGIKLPMNGDQGIDRRTFNMSRTTEDQAVSNYINLLLTFPGERFMQPGFGIGIQRFLFENKTSRTILNIEQVIREQSARWLPYIVNESIEILTSENGDIPSLGSSEENGLNIVITFKVTEFGANRTISIFPVDGNIQYTIL